MIDTGAGVGSWVGGVAVGAGAGGAAAGAGLGAGVGLGAGAGDGDVGVGVGGDGAAVVVRSNVAGPSPGALAVTVQLPAVLPAVAVTDTSPVALVVAVDVETVPAAEPLPGEKVTVTPGSGLMTFGYVSVTGPSHPPALLSPEVEGAIPAPSQSTALLFPAWQSSMNGNAEMVVVAGLVDVQVPATWTDHCPPCRTM